MRYDLNIKTETGVLKSVILGIANDLTIPSAEETYDPKSLYHVLNGTYPTEQAMVAEMESFAKLLETNNVKVYRPKNIPRLNQIFTRDVGFVIENTFVKANMIKDRQKEIEGLEDFLQGFENVLIPPPEVLIEGGDVILWKEYVFIGVYKGDNFADMKCARTNMAGINFIKKSFPTKNIIEFPLKKSNMNPKENCLHLDCCFQPIGNGLAIMYKDGFLDHSYQLLIEIFGESNILFVSKEDMSDMMCNIFSISPSIVVSDKSFTKINKWLESKNIKVETIEYTEISKQGGLFRCSTLPLSRDE